MKLPRRVLLAFLLLLSSVIVGCGGSNRTANRDITDEQQAAEDAALEAELKAEEAGQ